MTNTSNRYNLLYIALILFAIYLIIKWVGRLILGLLDYALFFAMILAVIWYIRLPYERKKTLQKQIKTNIKLIGKRLGID